jgi:hypothetical protein
MKSLRGEFREEYDQTGRNIRPPLPPPGRDRTPSCITIDFDTLQNKAVTIRQRDSYGTRASQDRITKRTTARPDTVGSDSSSERFYRWLRHGLAAIPA